MVNPLVIGLNPWPKAVEIQPLTFESQLISTKDLDDQWIDHWPRPPSFRPDLENKQTNLNQKEGPLIKDIISGRQAAVFRRFLLFLSTSPFVGVYH